MLSSHNYDQQFDHCYQKISDLVKLRGHRIDYQWIMSSGGDAFYPDYFTIESVGQSFIGRLLNRLISNRLGRFSISYTIVSRFVLLFYDLPYFTSGPHQEWLLNRLKRMPKPMTKWSLVEFFMFMDLWMKAIFSNELVSFKQTKHDLNESVLNLIRSFDFEDVTEAGVCSAIFAACQANWFDVVVPDFNDRKVSTLAVIRDVLSQKKTFPIDSQLRSMLFDAKIHIMYEADNAGEIIMDLFVIDKLIRLGHHVTLVGKYGPILNDVTISEIRLLIQHQTCFLYLKHALDQEQLVVISANYFPMVGKYLPTATDDYQNAAQHCDLFWLKGQANFQTMPIINHGLFKRPITYNKPILLNFIVKTPIVNYCLSESRIGEVSLGDPLICLV